MRATSRSLFRRLLRDEDLFAGEEEDPLHGVRLVALAASLLYTSFEVGPVRLPDGQKIYLSPVHWLFPRERGSKVRTERESTPPPCGRGEDERGDS